MVALLGYLAGAPYVYFSKSIFRVYTKYKELELEHHIRNLFYNLWRSTPI